MSNLVRRLWKLPKDDGDAVTPAAIDTGPSPAQWLGLKDELLAGFFDTGTGEVYTGVPIGPDDIVIDVGCGEGQIASFCARQGARVIAVDSHEDTLRAARDAMAAVPESGNERETILASAEDLPLPDGFATRVVCTEVLEHVDDPAVAMAELFRVGAPGALYLVTVPDPRSEEVQREMAPASYFEPPNHIRVISRGDFEDLVAGAGLELISHTYSGFFWTIWFGLFWSRDVAFDDASDPVLAHWTKCWAALLDSPNGLEVKRKLDQLMPKRQIIVARKPG